MNERTINNLVRITQQDTGERIEYYPGLFCSRTITRVKVTAEGERFLAKLHLQYLNDEISVDELIRIIGETARTIDSVYHDLIEDKFFEKLGAN